MSYVDRFKNFPYSVLIPCGEKFLAVGSALNDELGACANRDHWHDFDNGDWFYEDDRFYFKDLAYATEFKLRFG